MSVNPQNSSSCPICNKAYPIFEIEKHVNKCIFLNFDEDPHKRKRSPSPTLTQENKLPLKSPKNSKSDLLRANVSPRPHTPVFGQKNPKNQRDFFRPVSVDKAPVSEDSMANTSGMSFVVPLAKQVQPRSLDDFFGQNKVLGKDSVLRTLLEKGEIPNMILWGPPGCGKTSLSGVISEICRKDPKKYKFISLCGASAGVKEVQNIIAVAKNDLRFNKRTIIFMDEIHRFNKKQQDTFLLSVEKGEIVLVGATTENPSFILNSALLSRCRVVVMEKLQTEDLYSILEKAAEKLDIDVIDVENPCRVEDNSGLSIESTALQWLADISDGDARIALSNLQLVVQNIQDTNKTISVGDIQDRIKKCHMLYDRVGEEHYNIISAMHKSIRGSDANAALYWTTRMIVSGEDPRFIARRLVRAASEDIGNADPTALQLAVTTMQGCQLLGMPEADVLLAQCAIYLARAPKSREADSALAKAKRVIAECKGSQPAVPMHIRNAPTRLMKDLGYGRLAQGTQFTFMPPELKDVNFFE